MPKITAIHNRIAALDEAEPSQTQCGHHCNICSGRYDVRVFKRNDEEYIIFEGRLLLSHGAPVAGSRCAAFYLHEDIGQYPAAHWERYLWPKKAGVFGIVDTIELYRMLAQERESCRIIQETYEIDEPDED